MGAEDDGLDDDDDDEEVTYNKPNIQSRLHSGLQVSFCPCILSKLCTEILKTEKTPHSRTTRYRAITTSWLVRKCPLENKNSSEMLK